MECTSVISIPYDSPQGFRRVYRNHNSELNTTNDITYITPQFDHECGLYVIFWDEVLKTFEDVITFKIGMSSALFIKGVDRKNLFPLRLNICIGMILDIIIENPIDNPTGSPSSIQQPIEVHQDASCSTSRSPFLDPRPYDDSAFEKLLRGLDPTRGLGLTLKKAIDGNPESQTDIGSIYSSFHLNYAKRFEWSLKAADQGYFVAEYTIGYYYLKGIVVPQDYKKANEWLTKAAEKEYSPAQSEIGSLHRDGIEYPRDPHVAMEWYLKADKQGCPVSPMNIALLYGYKLGGSPDFSKVFKWYTKAVKRGSTAAQVEVGALYMVGKGVPKSLSKAEEWFLLAANQGNEYSQKWLSSFYATRKNVPLALKWKLIAAKQGSARMQSSLGKSFSNGNGVPLNYPAAVWWLSLASEEDSYYYAYIADIYKSGLGVPRDLWKAKDLYSKLSYHEFRDALSEVRRMEKKEWRD